MVLKNGGETDFLPVFSMREISVPETLRLIWGLGNYSACGRDGLDARIIKVTADILAPQIKEIINLFISTGVYTMKWKIGRIIPIQKSLEASRLLPSSFRPVSLLPTPSKIAECAVQQKVQSHFQKQTITSLQPWWH